MTARTPAISLSQYGPPLAVGVLLFSVLAGTAWSLPDNVTGTIQLNATTGTIDSVDRSSFNQRYALNWSKRLLPYMTARASLSYDRFGAETDASGSIWREQFQPVGELRWDHPLFSTGATYLQRKSNSQDDRAALVRNSLGLSFRTRAARYPTLTLRYDDDETYNDFNRAERDTREKRWRGTVSYLVKGQNFFYNVTRRDSDIRSSGTALEETRHLARWDQTTNLFAQRVRLNTGYNFSHRRQTTQVSGSSAVLRPIAVAAALYSQDATPEFGSLDSSRTLADGNTEDPAFPNINIGQIGPGQNVGVDFGFPRRTTGMYVYTDRPSGLTVTWTVYLSSDNLTWSLLEGVEDIGFNTSFSRYEIQFESIETRYIKAVSGGVNDVVTVLVTEVEVLEETTAQDTRTQSSHQGNASVTMRLRDNWQSNADMTYRTEPSSDFSNGRDQLFYGFSTRHRPWSAITHSLSYQAGWEDFQAGQDRLSSASLSYSLTATPLPTLTLIGSAVSRRDYVAGETQQEINSAQVRSTGAVLPSLNLTVDVGFSRTNQFLTRQSFETWSYQASTDTRVLRSTDVAVTYLYQSTNETGGAIIRVRRQVTGSLTLRLTRAILLRSSVSRDDDDGRETILQEYSGVWRFGGRTTLSAIARITDASGNIRTDRRSLAFNYSLNSRTSLVSSYTDTDTGGTGGRETNTFQVGIRTSI